MTDEATSPETQATLPVPRRSWVKTVALGTVVLLSGMVIGSGLTVIGAKLWFDQARARPELFQDRMLARMQKDLSLTNQQKAEIKKIFNDAHDDLEDYRQRHRAQTQAFFRDIHDKVAQVLTAKQQKEWDEWWRRARERATREGPGGTPRPGMGPGGPERERRPRMDVDRIIPKVPGGQPTPSTDQKDVTPAPPPNGIPERHFAPNPAAPGAETQPEVRRAPNPQTL